MKFKKQWMQGLVWEEHEEADIIENEITDTSRWNIYYRLVFKFENKFYRTSYERGATEAQYLDPFEYEPEEFECEEVFPQARTITVYEPIPTET